MWNIALFDPSRTKHCHILHTVVISLFTDLFLLHRSGSSWPLYLHSTYVPSSTLVSRLSFRILIGSRDCKRRFIHCMPKGGTKCLDRDWQALMAFVPKTANRKPKTNGHSHVSDTLQRRCSQWIWGKNLKNPAPNKLLEELRKLFRAA